MKQKEKKKPYINNNHLFAVMLEYHTATKKAKQDSTKLPKIPDYIGECFILICNKLAGRGNFISYSYRDEMISDAIENCVAAVDSFDPEKSKNPFAYFTQIAWYAFIRRIAKEKKQTYIKHRNARNSSLWDGEIVDNNEYSNRIIQEYEEKMEKVKKPKKKVAAKLTGE